MRQPVMATAIRQGLIVGVPRDVAAGIRSTRQGASSGTFTLPAATVTTSGQRLARRVSDKETLCRYSIRLRWTLNVRPASISTPSAQTSRTIHNAATDR
jgi:hypothetical protein